MKRLVPFIAIAIIVFIFYKESPYFQGKVADAQNNLTKWSEDNIRKNPAGFLDMAEGKIKKSLAGLEESKGKIDITMTELRGKREGNQNRVDTATTLTSEFKTAYKAAKADGSWPATIRGQAYNLDQLKKQVKLLMDQKQSLSTMIVSQDQALAKAGEAQTKLKAQITKLQGELQQIGTKRETLIVDELTAESQHWLDRVNEQVTKSSDLANMGKDPVIDLEDFMEMEAAAQKKAEEAAAVAEGDQKTIDFLDS
jgi:phage shock protein A